ncbi:MAG: CHAT domain-containing protein [Intrasporangium sp.]|uniref:CHAT domain-containing protein n=1 Tax=Intrasporangium sp. TaxID=1925024 RepID=UPI0026472BA7|nr:CHAT domain-containing protein [Intrasporangium sp.]MDN5795093.1 CHAT domain-containing protein [Intrasporangium sp.]
MPVKSFAGGAVRLDHPSSYAARPAERSRSLPGEPGYETQVSKDALLAALGDTGFEHLQSVDVAPRRTRTTDRGAPGDTRTLALDVDVAADQDAVVLFEQDGVYSWHLPVAPADADRSIDPGPRTRHFEIDVRPGAPTPSAGPEGIAGTRRTRGILGSIIQGAAQAIVFRFAAPFLVDKAIDLMEKAVRPGLLHLTSPDITDWRRVDTLDELHLPTDRPLRVLLFVHGTFSSTAGGFGALTVTDSGRAFLTRAIDTYDAVLGFEHVTLSVDPRQNAKDLLRRLSAHHPDADFTIDIITHSRGGLTTRCLAEHELPASSWPGRVDRVVFVAATNAGTHLADPDRWSDLVDLYTNLAAATARALALLPGAAPVAAIVAGVVKGIGAFVKYLVAYAGDKNGVPGLAAMVPAGAFVTDLNKEQPGQPAPGASWFVVSSNFHVSLLDDSHHPPEFPRELVVKLKEGFVDQLFKADNDLVVDTASMSAIGLPTGGFVADQLALGTNDVVFHSNYFSQDRVLAQFGRWLLPHTAMAEPPATAAEPPATAAEPPATAAEPPATGDRGLPPVPDVIESGSRELAPAVPAPAPEALADGAKVEAHLAAEMPATMTPAESVDLRVRLSRKAVNATPGAAHDEAVAAVDDARPLSVRVVGKRNAEIVGTDVDVFALPPGGGTSELTFKVRARRPGPVEVTVVVRQGSVPIGTLRLRADAQTVTHVPAATAAAAVTGPAAATAQAPLGIDAPELEGLPCLEIFETDHGDDEVVFEYALRLEQGGMVHRFTSEPLRDRATFVRALLGQVEDAWLEQGDRPAAYLAAIQDLGASLFEQIFPQDMQAMLWKHRNRITDLLVYADEPYVPWELVHLKPPVGPRQKTPRFLAQHGLVRWQFTGFPPKTLRARAGRVRSLCPTYLDPAFVLAETGLEAQFLATKLGATPVKATPTDVRRLLRRGDFDLLHFAGHGLADPTDIFDAKVLLQGRKRGNSVLPQYLTATNVSENGRWTVPGSGPIVVLNACQVGRGGEQLSTLGGFAKAFLDAGASAFVSSLWSVGDEPARTFVETFYDELLSGTPVALATSRAREQARASGDATWLAYVVYARPDATLELT